MKTKTDSPADDRPSEAEIREYAHHLYVSSGWLPGRDLDNWLEAEAHLVAERKAHGRTRKRPTHEDVSTMVLRSSERIPELVHAPGCAPRNPFDW
ncbi:MAG: DUF2934 domain-containing protein [Opitutaceae bacterium]|nr:DUF2934 domain-containing protein [Opitutaceae bacterium]